MVDLVQSLIRELREALAASQDNVVPTFDAVLRQLGGVNDPSVIRELYGCFDDTFPFDGPMFGFIHLAERFDEATYIQQLLQAIEGMVSSSPRWASIVLMRVLNSDSHREELTRQLSHATDGQQAAVRRLAEAINQRSPNFLAKTTAIMVATSVRTEV